MSNDESPDIRPYVPAAPFGRSAVEVAVAILQDLASKFPGVTLNENQTEVLVAETVAVVVAQLGLAVDRTPAIVTEVLLRLFDVARSGGARATVDIDFTLTDTAGHTIPAGTEVALDVAGAPVVFATDDALVVAPASSTGTAAATATTIGATANGVAAGTPVRIRSGGVSWIQGAELGNDVADGLDPEVDATYFARAVQRFARLSDALVRPEHFQTFALEDPAILRALPIDRFNGTTGTPGEDTGHMTVVVRGASGNLSGPAKTALHDAMEAKAMAGLVIHVIDPTVTTVNVAVTVVKTSTAVTGDVDTAAEAAVEAFLDPSTWPWGFTVRLSDVIALLEAIPGVDYVNVATLLLNGVHADLALTGPGPLADAGTIAVTVA